MSLRAGDNLTVEFVTSNPNTAAVQTADSLPAVTMVHNGSDDGAVTVTVTLVDTGRYKAACTIPNTYSGADIVELSASATVASVAGKAIVFRTSLDRGTTVYGSNGSILYTFTVYQPGGVTPVPGASVFVSSDSAGTNRSQARTTDALGNVQFNLDPATVYFWVQHPDWVFPNPFVEVVS